MSSAKIEMTESGTPSNLASPFDSVSRSSYHKGMKTTISEKGQVTIPKPLRVRLGLFSGQVLEVKEESGRLVMAKSVPYLCCQMNLAGCWACRS